MTKDELLDEMAEFVKRVLNETEPTDGQLDAATQFTELLLINLNRENH